MDIVKKIKETMTTNSISLEKLSKLCGIDEYTLYYVLNYRQYISRVGVIVLTSVLNVDLNYEDIDLILLENKRIVGLPDTNMEIAANYVSIDYVEKLERELKNLIPKIEQLDNKNLVIASLRNELDTIINKYNALHLEIDLKEKSAYSKGVFDTSKKYDILYKDKEKEISNIVKDKYLEVEQQLRLEIREVSKKYTDLKNFILNDYKLPLPLKFNDVISEDYYCKIKDFISKEQYIEIIDSLFNWGHPTTRVSENLSIDLKIVNDIYENEKNKRSIEKERIKRKELLDSYK